MLRGQKDVKALNIPRRRDVKLNELPKQIFMLLPLLLHWLDFFIVKRLGPRAPGGPPRMKKKVNEAAEAWA